MHQRIAAASHTLAPERAAASGGRGGHDLALIVDFGSQFTRLIARRLREISVYCEIHPFSHVDRALLERKSPRAIILSGGPCSVLDETSPRIDDCVFAFGVPVLGICYGQQLMAQAFGGMVSPGGEAREFGRAELVKCVASPLLEDFADEGHEAVWMSHGDSLERPPEGFQVVAMSGNAPCAVIADEARRLYGVQFHPEVTHTPKGARLLQNFTHRIAGFRGDWTMASFLGESVRAIRARVGKARVICGLSGGVDSAVAAALIHRAIGAQLTCIFVDTGLLRANEAEEVVSLFRTHFRAPLVHLRAEEAFLSRLAGVEEPEEKRRIIGHLFIELFEREAHKIRDARFLAQGTLYPDVIESLSAQGGPSATIKTHHNVGGLPDAMNLTLLEPLRDLFKDEVRALGATLGLQERFIWRHPFPGPGLAIRVIGEISRDAIAMLRSADAIFLEDIRKAGLYREIWQAFAVLLPVKSVGVMGDSRTFEQVCALRAVCSTDGMTAEASEIPHALLARIATRIVNEVPGINRVVYDVTSKPPGTIEWE